MGYGLRLHVTRGRNGVRCTVICRQNMVVVSSDGLRVGLDSVPCDRFGVMRAYWVVGSSVPYSERGRVAHVTKRRVSSVGEGWSVG